MSACLVPLAKRAARVFDVVAKPSSDRWHEGSVPLLGGAAIVGSFVCLAMLFPMAASALLTMGVVLMFALGLVDDIHPLTPLQKLVLEAAVIGVLMAAGEEIHFFSTDWLDIPLTVLWLLSCVNAFNLLDHLDGLSAGVAIVGSCAIAGIGIIHRDFRLALTAFTLAGSLGGFLIYNIKPASIFMGDAGALAVGLALGLLAGRSADGAANVWSLRAGVVLFVTMVPVIDTTVVTVTRLATCNPISKGRRDHSSHRLVVGLGLSERSAAASLYFLAAIGGAAGCLLASLRPAYAISILPFAMLIPALSALYLMNLSFGSPGPASCTK
jgi:UDP-GlcNAc:undecaprenyl-phosphate GlcNAc-1-phosphate transferase